MKDFKHHGYFKLEQQRDWNADWTVEDTRSLSRYFQETHGMDGDQAFRVVHDLQEWFRMTPDHHERCCNCGYIYDSHCQGADFNDEWFCSSECCSEAEDKWWYEAYDPEWLALGVDINPMLEAILDSLTFWETVGEFLAASPYDTFPHQLIEDCEIQPHVTDGYNCRRVCTLKDEGRFGCKYENNITISDADAMIERLKAFAAEKFGPDGRLKNTTGAIPPEEK